MKVGQFYYNFYSDAPTAVAGKCTTTFHAEPQSSQTAKKRRNDVPHNSSDSSDSEVDSDV